MPPEAKVAIIDGNAAWRFSHAQSLSAQGHETKAVATDFPEAQKLIPQLGALGVQVVLIDNNLSYWQGDKSEGEVLTKAIKAAFPDMTIVGVTTDGVEIPGTGANVSKKELAQGTVDLGEFVTNLK
jgi:DNA-binding NtrC family response regulator